MCIHHKQAGVLKNGITHSFSVLVDVESVVDIAHPA
jgi:hypothetical protein